MPRITAMPTLTTPSATDVLAVVDGSSETTKQITIASLLGILHPVGSLYFNVSDDSNPADFFGFGTWEAFGSGRVPVGYDADDSDFSSPEQTGGQKVVQEHNHQIGVDDSGGWASGAQPVNAATRGANSYVPGTFSDRPGTATTTSQFVQSTGDGENNMNPYIVVYMWKRTA